MGRLLFRRDTRVRDPDLGAVRKAGGNAGLTTGGPPRALSAHTRAHGGFFCRESPRASPALCVSLESSSWRDVDDSCIIYAVVFVNWHVYKETDGNRIHTLSLFSSLVVSDSLRPHGPQLARFLHPWDSPGENPGVSCRFLLQGIFPTPGLDACLLLWQADSSPLSRLGSPYVSQSPDWSSEVSGYKEICFQTRQAPAFARQLSPASLGA